MMISNTNFSRLGSQALHHRFLTTSTDGSGRRAATIVPPVIGHSGT